MKTNIVGIILFIVIITLSCKKNVQLFELPNDVILQTGDIVFRSGESIESKVVKTFDSKSVYSHVGLIVRDNNEWYVLHSVPNEAKKNEKDTLKLESLNVFFQSDRAASGAVYRLNNQNDTARIYDICKDIYSRKTIFDGAFSLEDTNRFYCTELVWHIYDKYFGIDLSEGRRYEIPMLRDVIMCSNIMEYPDLKLIYKFD